jgi:hypothetical protein
MTFRNSRPVLTVRAALLRPRCAARPARRPVRAPWRRRTTPAAERTGDPIVKPSTPPDARGRAILANANRAHGHQDPGLHGGPLAVADVRP